MITKCMPVDCALVTRGPFLRKIIKLLYSFTNLCCLVSFLFYVSIVPYDNRTPAMISIYIFSLCVLDENINL